MLRFVCALAAVFFASASAAAPWISPGDNRMRHSLQLMADNGELDTPIQTWPVMWSGVGPALRSSASTRTLNARSYVRFEENRFARTGWKSEIELGGANQSPLVRGFAGQPRERGELGGSVQWSGREWAFGLRGHYVEKPSDDREWRADGSYVAYTGGDWTLGVGAIDRWWGPGRQSSLMLSSNARPVPSVWINRTHPGASDHPLLGWLGPWQFTLMVGQLENDRSVSEPFLVGMRFNFRPLQRLELGLSRMFFHGGGDEPENASALWSSLRVRDSGDRAHDADPTQRAGMDFRYGGVLEEFSGGVYGEAVGHWREGGSLGRFTGLAGVELAFPFANHDQRWFIEYSDTTAGSVFASARENVAYEDGLYRTGHRFRGRSLGSSLDGDARSLSLGMQHFFSDGRDLEVTLSRLEFNRSDNLVLVPPEGAVDVAIARGANDVVGVSARYAFPLWGGRGTLDGHWNDRRVEIATADGSGRSRGTLTANWRYRF